MITYTLVFEKSTKNMHVYVHPEKKGVTAYLPKSDFPSAPPQIQASFKIDGFTPVTAPTSTSKPKPEEDGLE